MTDHRPKGDQWGMYRTENTTDEPPSHDEHELQ